MLFRSTSSQACLERLRQRGILQPDPLGLGLATTERGALLKPDGQPWEGLFNLGSARKGQLWESIAVPELRLQAEALADALLRTLSPPLRSLPPVPDPASAGASPAGVATSGPSFLWRQLFDQVSSSYTYLIADPVSRAAVLVDPVLEQIGRAHV